MPRLADSDYSGYSHESFHFVTEELTDEYRSASTTRSRNFADQFADDLDIDLERRRV